jgi:hypothetical protein
MNRGLGPGGKPSDRILTQEDPIGFAGGLNLYASRTKRRDSADFDRARDTMDASGAFRR